MTRPDVVTWLLLLALMITAVASLRLAYQIAVDLPAQEAP